jgi:hypothetical protein
MTILHDTLVWLAAADREVLADSPEEDRHRFVAAGGAVLATTGMAFLSGTFTFHQMLHASLTVAILLGLAFALTIMNLERYVQASIKRQGTALLTLLSAVPRFALAFLMGLVLSIPLLLVVFGTEVNLQASNDRSAELFTARQAIERQFHEIDQLQRRADTLEGQIHTIKTGTALKTSPAYRALGRRLSKLQELRRTTADKHLARSYARQAEGTLKQIRPLRQQLLHDEGVQTDEAHAAQRRELATVHRALDPMLTERDRKIGELGRKYRGDPGLADRIKALDELAKHNTAVAWLKKVLWLFVLTIDSLPALLKTLTCMQRKSVYEETLEARELRMTQTTVRVERARTDNAIRDATAYYEAQSEIAAERLAQHVELQKEMDDIYMRAVRDELKPRAEAAARRAAARYADQMEDYLSGSSSEPADPAAETAGERARGPRPRPGFRDRAREWFGVGRRGNRPAV